MALSISGSYDINDYIKNLMKAGSKRKGSTDLVPYQVISGSGPGYYFAPEKRRIITISRGTEVYVLPLEPDKDGRYHVVNLQGQYFMVPGDEIIDLGFN